MASTSGRWGWLQPWHRLVLVWSLFPDSLVQVVGLLFYIEAVSRFCFYDFEICEVRLSYDGHTAVFLNVYHTPPTLQNKLTNAMFLEQFSDLLESYVYCDRLFVEVDLNIHFDKPSGPCTSALNVVLDNLSLHQLVNVPTSHWRGHTLDWLVTNIATDVLDLTVVDM